MQRISAVYAKPGMTIVTPIYDSWGDVVLEKDKMLDAKDIAAITDSGIGEVFISNEYTQDIVVQPVITPDLSGAVSKALRRVIIDVRTILTGKNQQSVDISQLKQYVIEIMEQLKSVDTGNASICGCFSIRDYNYVHPVKVCAISLLIGKTLNLDESQLINLGLAALLQNVGYVLVPQGILEKAGPLNDAEVQVVQKHPIYGSEILQRYGQEGYEIADIVLQHHERWNGSGYPFQLPGDGISLPAQILGITDTCFALASKRPHREEFLPVFAIEHSIVSPQDAMEFILAYSGELFNPELVRIFVSHVPIYPTGVRIKLNDGHEGVVYKSNEGLIRRPQVRIFPPYIAPALEPENDGDHSDGESDSYDLDLAQKNHRRTFIVEAFDY
jgi:HD-GYP domain-containing protein (c-di-GMP phosphodiesterase class II)